MLALCSESCVTLLTRDPTPTGRACERGNESDVERRMNGKRDTQIGNRSRLSFFYTNKVGARPSTPLSKTITRGPERSIPKRLPWRCARRPPLPRWARLEAGKSCRRPAATAPLSTPPLPDASVTQRARASSHSRTGLPRCCSPSRNRRACPRSPGTHRAEFCRCGGQRGCTCCLPKKGEERSAARRVRMPSMETNIGKRRQRYQEESGGCSAWGRQ